MFIINDASGASLISSSKIQAVTEAMKDVTMRETTGSNTKPSGRETQVAARKFDEIRFSYEQKVQQFIARLNDEDRLVFGRGVQKLLFDLGDELGVDLLLLSGSEDDPEVLAVKAVFVQRRRTAELEKQTKQFHI